MKNIILLLVALFCGTALMGQKYTDGEARFEWRLDGKYLVLGDSSYKELSRSIFTNGIDTLEKLQTPRQNAEPVERPGYTHVIRMKEPLAFKNQDCVSWQWVDIYRWIGVDPIVLDSTQVDSLFYLFYVYERETFYVDTGSIQYVGIPPVDTSVVSLGGYLGGTMRSPLAFTLGFLGEFANAKTDPRDSSILVNNFRHQFGAEAGIFRSIKQYNIACDSCYFWGPEQNAFQIWTDIFLRTSFGPRKRYLDGGLNVFLFGEARYRILGPVDAIPVTKGISRISFQLGGGVQYGPITFRAGVIETLGKGLSGGVQATWNFVSFNPKGKKKRKE